MSYRPTVIIADSSEAFLMYMSILLQRLDFEVLPVGTGTNVIKMAKAVTPNLVIMGTNVPEMNGLEVLQAMKNEKDLATIPVLMAGEASQDEKTCRDLGCQAYLNKPIDIDQLHSELESCDIYPGRQRRFKRAPFQNKVKLIWNNQDYECQAVTLSEGGIYLRKKMPFPQGCLLDVSIPLSGGKTLDLEGEVIYTKQLSEDRFTMPPGMAIRFLLVDTDNAKILDEQITELLVGDIIEEQDEPVIQN